MTTTIEREQKFLVDSSQFKKTIATAPWRVRQCYIATQSGRGWEVRFREVTDSRSTSWSMTLKRPHGVRDCLNPIQRDEVEVPLAQYVFDAAWTASAWRVEKLRYDVEVVGANTRVTWQVDEFTSGLLKGVVVAELEMPAGYGDVGVYLRDIKSSWPKWIKEDATEIFMGNPHPYVDLTTERVNLVAADAVAASSRLRQLLGKTALDEMTAIAQQAGQYDAGFPTYTKRPFVAKLTRQGVRDLGTKKGAL